MKDARPRRARSSRQDQITAIVFSIVLGLGLWFFARGEVEQKRTIQTTFLVSTVQGVKVNPTRMPVTLVLRGPKARIDALPAVQGSFDVPSSETDSSIMLRLDRSYFNLPPDIKVISISPPRVELDISTMISRTLPVRLRLAGEPDPGFSVNIETSSVSPAEAVVHGPASLLGGGDVMEIFTEPVSVAFRSSSLTLQGLALDTSALGEDVSTRDRVTARVVIEPKRETRSFEDCPVRSLLPPNATFLPVVKKPAVTLEISGPHDALFALRKEEILVYIPIDDIRPTPFYVECVVELPPGKMLSLLGPPPRVAVDDIVETIPVAVGESGFGEQP